MNKQTQKTNRQTNKQTKIPGSGTIEFQSYFKLWCYTSSIQSWCWYLIISSVVVSPGHLVVFAFFFFCLSVAAGWSAPPSVGVAVWVCMLSLGSRISSVAYQLSCIGVGFLLYLITGGLVLCFAPFLWGKVSDPSASPLLSVCCDGFLIVFQFCNVIWLWMLLCWLFFNFAMLFDFGCCSLVQEMNFGDHYLPYFRQQLVTSLLLALCLSVFV
jgi:hypothetical protein